MDTETFEYCKIQITKDGRLVDELTFQRRALHRECSDRHRETMAAVAATKISDAQVGITLLVHIRVPMACA